MRAQTVNFERGLDPKKSLDIGKQSLVKEIDSYDLFLLSRYTENGNAKGDSDNLRNTWMYDGEEELQHFIERAQKLSYLLLPHLIWDTHNSWDARAYGESEGLKKYFERNLNNTNKKYAYDYTPEGDFVNIVWSDIELPAADNIRGIIEEDYYG